MEGLDEQEIEGIWTRIKKYIDLNKITAADKTNQKKQLEDIMSIQTAGDNATPQATMDYLVKKHFPSEAIKNKKINSELFVSVEKTYKEKVRTKFVITAQKEITVKSGRMKGYRYIQYRGHRTGETRSYITGGLYTKKR